MLRDWKAENEKRVSFIRDVLLDSGANGIVYGNSGGKDSTLVGMLCRQATENTLGLIMPCVSKSNYSTDREHALLVAEKYKIRTVEVDLGDVKTLLSENLGAAFNTIITSFALANINPRLRMIALYAVAQSLGYLVVGTGNRSEATMGYFTKWGDGANDFNPIGDLTVTEIYEFLEYLGAPQEIIKKAPSAGLWEGQTDEQEMGITYKEIDDYLLHGIASAENAKKIEMINSRTQHKREMPRCYCG